MANWAVELFGKELLTKDGCKATEGIVAGKKAVLVYFSAHWCPPCRGFTPVLADAYKKHTQGDVEVIFVSSDRDDSSFANYFAEMPWTAVPFADRNRKEIQRLCKKFSVSGIPTLIVLNGADGKVVSENGRGEVQSQKDLEKCLPLWIPSMNPRQWYWDCHEKKEWIPYSAEASSWLEKAVRMAEEDQRFISQFQAASPGYVGRMGPFYDVINGEREPGKEGDMSFPECTGKVHLVDGTRVVEIYEMKQYVKADRSRWRAVKRVDMSNDTSSLQPKPHGGFVQDTILNDMNRPVKRPRWS